MSASDVHERLRRAAELLDQLQPEERDRLLDRQITAFRTLAGYLEDYGQWRVAPCFEGLIQAADAVLAGHDASGGEEYELLRSAIRPCVPMVRECQPPRLGVQVMERTILLPVAHPALVRADMIVLRGNAVQVLAGPSEYDWAASVRRWPVLADSLAGTVFLACVRVLPCTVAIQSRDIFTPQFAGDVR